jgi:hypothetical protein
MEHRLQVLSNRSLVSKYHTFYSACTNVISFKTVKKYGLPRTDFHETSNYSSKLWADFLHRILSKSNIWNVGTEIYLRPNEKNGFHWADFHENHKHSTYFAFWTSLAQKVIRIGRNCREQGQNFIYALLRNVCLLLHRFSRKLTLVQQYYMQIYIITIFLQSGRIP